MCGVQCPRETSWTTTTSWRLQRHTIVALFLLPSVAGCPVPIAYTETISPPVVGTYYRSDGTPASGVPIALSPGWNDTWCTHTPLRTTSDSAGAFRFPSTQERYRVFWVIPNLDRAPASYSLCVTAGVTLRPAYQGYGSRKAGAPADSLSCLEWSWEDRTRILCSSTKERTVVTGGYWRDSNSTGWYRLLLTVEPTRVKRHRTLVQLPHLFVQWIEATSNGIPFRVRTTAEVPLGSDAISLQHMAIENVGDKWYANLYGYKKRTFLNTAALGSTSYELGPPGQAKAVARAY